MLLTTLILLPILGSASLFLVAPENRRRAKDVGIFFSFLTLVWSVIMLSKFKLGGSEMQFAERKPWIPEFGINYILGLDGLSVWLVVLTTLLIFLVVVASDSITQKYRSYLGCMLLLESGILGAFLALDGITFYVFWELMLIPMYFLIGIWGGKRRIYAAIKFVLFTATGSLMMLVAIIYLACLHFKQFGSYSFYLGDWSRLVFQGDQELLLFSAFALAFLIKIPVFPFHTWLPDAHVEAPTGGSVILAGVLLKLGIYGLIRFGIPVFPDAVVLTAPILGFLGVFGIIYGALVAWVQTDMKKLVAYSSVSHLGFCVLGFSVMNIQGMQGSILQMINHGVSTAALFFLVGVLYDRKHTREISAYGGIAQKMPLFSFVFLVFTLSSIGLPLTNGFIGEFLILLGGFKYNIVLGALAVTGVVLGAIYMLSLYRRVFFGAFDESKNGDLEDLTVLEKMVFLPLLALVLAIGILPGPFLEKIEPAAEAALSYLPERSNPQDDHLLRRNFLVELKTGKENKFNN